MPLKLTSFQKMALKDHQLNEKGDGRYIEDLLTIIFGNKILSKSSATGVNRSVETEYVLDATGFSKRWIYRNYTIMVVLGWKFHSGVSEICHTKSQLKTGWLHLQFYGGGDKTIICSVMKLLHLQIWNEKFRSLQSEPLICETVPLTWGWKNALNSPRNLMNYTSSFKLAFKES